MLNVSYAAQRSRPEPGAVEALGDDPDLVLAATKGGAKQPLSQDGFSHRLDASLRKEVVEVVIVEVERDIRSPVDRVHAFLKVVGDRDVPRREYLKAILQSLRASIVPLNSESPRVKHEGRHDRCISSIGSPMRAQIPSET